ncbi:MAG: Polysaccharide biosynthesis/export protein [Pedosphaera sp.]|nr:Polysaccharide biosynthesis/export protein [Pedosphaera sp.]
MKFSGLWVRLSAVLFAGLMLAGCQSPDSGFKFDPLAENSGASMAGAGGPALAPMAMRDPQRLVDPNGSPILHVGDQVTVTFQDLVTPIMPVEGLVKEDGRITLIYNKQFQADGKTVGQLERDIRAVYVPDYFVNMTPTVTIKERFYSVGGEVKMPNRQAYVGRMRVLQAIDSAGGFTDYARKSKVIVTRGNGKQETVNAAKALKKPELNIEIFPGDQVFVEKRPW